MNRRDAIRLTAAATLSATLAPRAFAVGNPLRVLILGGTGFIGPHFVDVLQANGHTLTLFNRGRRDPGLHKDVEALVGDRDGKVDALKGRDWDVVIDNSGYLPAQVQLTCDVLKGRVQQYIFISSISAYADLAKPGIDEDYRLATLKDPGANQVTDENYGGLKAACEKIVQAVYGADSTVIRPSYIVGPGDTTDRFTYWPVRVARGGDMLAPGTASDPVQFIDVRDLAGFMSVCVARRISGTYNLCIPPRSVTMGELLTASKQAAKSDAALRWASVAFLEQHKVLETGELPIWAPPTGLSAGASLVNSARAVGQGLTFRPLLTTVADTLAWHRQRPAAQQQALRAGLTPQREAALLKMLPA